MPEAVADKAVMAAMETHGISAVEEAEAERAVMAAMKGGAGGEGRTTK